MVAVTEEEQDINNETTTMPMKWNGNDNNGNDTNGYGANRNDGNNDSKQSKVPYRESDKTTSSRDVRLVIMGTVTVVLEGPQLSQQGGRTIVIKVIFPILIITFRTIASAAIQV